MYELLVLSLLMTFPLHAYLMADIANAILGPWERISRGTLSTLVARLERDGLIAAADPSDVPFPSERASTAWAITPAGRARFRRLMLDTTTNPGAYTRRFHIKALNLHLLPPDEQLSLLDHYIGYCQTGLRYLEREAHDMGANPAKRRHTPEELGRVALSLMALQNEEWRLEVAWARELRERVVAARGERTANATQVATRGARQGTGANQHD